MQTVQFVASPSPRRAQEPSRLPEPQNRCSSCSLHQLCLPTGLSEADMQRLDGIIVRRRKIARDDVLYGMNDSFTNLYAVRLGHFKTHQVSADGSEQITGFQMGGELLGMDGISTDRHHCY